MKLNRIVLVLVLGVLFLMPMLFFKQVVASSYEEIVYSEDAFYRPSGSWHIRLYTLKNALPAILDKPVLGHGFGSVMSHHHLENNFYIISKEYLDYFSLNTYYVFGVESGILAFGAFVFMIVFSLHSLFKKYKAERNDSIKIISCALFLSILSYSLSIGLTSQLDAFPAFFTILAIAQNISGTKRIAIGV